MSNEANLTGACAGPGNPGNPLVEAGEELFTLTEATKAMPRVNGKRPAVSTLWRWCRKGLKGVHLEYLRVGRNIVTSREALLRFFAALAEADECLDGGRPIDPVIRRNRRFLCKRRRTPAERQRAIEEAERELAEAGI